MIPVLISANCFLTCILLSTTTAPGCRFTKSTDDDNRSSDQKLLFSSSNNNNKHELSFRQAATQRLAAKNMACIWAALQHYEQAASDPDSRRVLAQTYGIGHILHPSCQSTIQTWRLIESPGRCARRKACEDGCMEASSSLSTQTWVARGRKTIRLTAHRGVLGQDRLGPRVGDLYKSGLPGVLPLDHETPIMELCQGKSISLFSQYPRGLLFRYIDGCK